MREITEKDMEVAHSVARAYCRKKGFQNYDDVVGDALEGLARAARDYDPGKGSGWGTYSYTRILGSVLDAAKRNGRQTRRQARDRVDVLAPLSLNVETNQGVDLVEALKGSDGMADEVENRYTVRDAFRALTEREKFVLWMHYVQGYPQKEVGQWIGVTEARVNQIIKVAREKLS